MIPQPERDVFESKINEFKDYIEERTPEDADFTLILGKDDWCPGLGGTFKQGEAITFDVREANGRQLFGSIFPMTRRSGELWDRGGEFSFKLEKFLKFARGKIINTYLLGRAIDDAGKTRKPRPIYPNDAE